MADVFCLTCDEPWEIAHLREAAIAETALDAAGIAAWRRLPTARRLGARYRQLFAAAGYDFGVALTDLRRCPCCPPVALSDSDRLTRRSILAAYLRADDDGLATALTKDNT